ncbi:macoilin-2-like [Sycon ciliatum]|uniref:macoilin-2-like n=1 Tax=Sycon ciliatum TaxID=27933 RepID=UPI0031F6F541
MRRRQADASRPPKRPIVKRPTEQGPGFAQYVKVFAAWAALLLLDHLFEQRLELLIPLYSLWRSVLYLHRVDGAVMIGLFLGVSLLVDWMCLWCVPIHWLFFIGSVHIWVQMLWQADSDLYVATILLFVCFVYVEATIRLHTLPIINVYRLLAAHCTGSPLIMLVLDVKELLKFHLRKRRRKEVESDNRYHLHLVEGSLPAPLRIQCNDYAESSKGDQRSASSASGSKTISLATAQDMEVHSQTHSGFILWLLRFIFRHVSSWLESAGSGGDKTTADGSNVGSNSTAASSGDGQNPLKDIGASSSSSSSTVSGSGSHGGSGASHVPAARDASAGVHASSAAGSSSNTDSIVQTHRRRHDNRPASNAVGAHSGAQSHGKQSKAAAHSEHIDAATLQASSPSESAAYSSDGGGRLGSIGSCSEHSGVTGNRPEGLVTISEDRSLHPRTVGNVVNAKKSAPSPSPVATVAPVASTHVHQQPASRKESRLQQDLSQVKAKFTASQQREERLNDQVDDLRDGMRKIQSELKETQQELKESRDEAERVRRQLNLSSQTNSTLQKECEAKADQVAAARQAHDTAENALRDFTRKVAADSSSIHQACHGTQQSLQRECEAQTRTIRHLEQLLAAEKGRSQLVMLDAEKLKAECVKIERKLSNEHREKMAVVSTNRDLRKELDEKRNECRRLEQQVTEALAVMPIQSFMAEGSGDRSGGRTSSSFLGSMEDSWAKFGSMMVGSGEGDEDGGTPLDLSPLKQRQLSAAPPALPDGQDGK